MSARTVFTNPVHFLAFGGGSGLAPKAPGTFGTLVGIPFFLLFASLPLPVYILITAVMFAVGIWICGRSSALLGVHDHPGIVWDEIVGFLVTM
ncbi:MAG TPA: phosphatidylglycerophosphatase A, partial [Gammaproteobacteria bacterium]|nr:phosphatidylglycerophosphatase A [Gammaproteobacteria bacterium]